MACIKSKTREMKITAENQSAELREKRQLAGDSSKFFYERIDVCRRCDWLYKTVMKFYCMILMRRFGRTLWPDATADVAKRAKEKEGFCPLHLWSQSNLNIF